MPNVIPYGFETIAHVIDDRLITEVGIEEVATATRISMELHNRVMNNLLDIFVMETTDYKRRFLTPHHASLQPIDPETGRALPGRVGGHYDVGWPMKAGAYALARTFRAAQKMTMRELVRRVLTMQEADRRWVRNHLLAALFTNVSWTFTDEEYGDVTVYPLANNDTVTYFKKGDADAPSTDNHFLSQANNLGDGADNMLKTLADTLREHPENGDGEVVAFVPTNLEDEVMGLALFNDKIDPNIRYGSASDILSGTAPALGIGELIGYDAYSRTWVYRWDVMPSNYIIATILGGEKPLAMRVHRNPSWRGFFEDYQREDAPFTEVQYKREMGLGAWNRVGAAIGQVSDADATYDIPSGYNYSTLPG